MIPSGMLSAPPILAAASSPPANFADALTSAAAIILSKVLPESVATPIARLISYQAAAFLPIVLPDATELISMWQSGAISDDVMRQTLRLHGCESVVTDIGRMIYQYDGGRLRWDTARAKFDRTIWDQTLLHRHWSPDISTLSMIRNRGLADPSVLSYWFSRLGVVDKQCQEMAWRLGDYVPSASELIRYAVREVFNPELVKQLGLSSEFPPAFRQWARLSGMRTITDPLSIVDGKPAELDVPEAEWIAHWVHASPTQSYQGLHRLRPDNIERVRADLKQRLDEEVKAGLTTRKEADELVAGLKPITVSDVARLLKVNDYAPIWRPMLTAISYTPLTRVDIRRMLQVGELTPEELPGRYQDIGYSPSDSVRLASFTMRLRARSAQQAVIRRTKQQITGAYELGVIGETEARQQLMVHGLTEQEANAALVSIRLELRVRYVRRAISVVRGRYKTGAIDDDEAMVELRRLSLDEARIKDLVELWALERTGRAREVSTAQILGAYIDGIIFTPEVTMRLGNLGYKTSDIRMLLEHAEAKGAAKAEKKRKGALPKAKAADVQIVPEMLERPGG